MGASWPSMTESWHTAAYPAILPTRPEQSAAGKTVVVTGGGAGIGAAIAESFAVAGASTIGIVGRTQKTLTETASKIEAAHKGVKVLTGVADILDAAALKNTFDGFKAAAGPINIFVNNAAFFPNPSSLQGADVEEWWKGFEINIKGSLNVIQAFLPNVAPDATVINVTTAVAHVPYIPGASSYGASKMAGTKIFEYLQAEHPEFRVHQFHPGVIMSDMGNKALEAGLVLPQDEISLPAAYATWVASPEAAYLKGKITWAQWDVDELKTKAKEIEGSPMLTLGLNGWPTVMPASA